LHKVLHIEPTDVCQAACPQCAREIDVSFNKKIHNHLTIDKIKNLLSEEEIYHLDKMFMCGNYGDPAAGYHTLEIYNYFRKINPNVVLGMNTNGGLQAPSWWISLANILNQPEDYVVFSIDGLADTNHLYRKNVLWDKVVQNVQAFINAGGNAHWDMLVFEHNQHQVDECENMAKEMGFKFFRAKSSRRHKLVPISFLNPPKGWIDYSIYNGNIYCMALKENSIYLSATGKLAPCCWLPEDYSNFDNIKKSWDTDHPNKICKSTCSVSTNGNSFTNQWQREIQFV
jgi:MoaA/NifB/PqqE/SkfB family radical SAM enzyme